jgi:hypothetical protein
MSDMSYLSTAEFGCFETGTVHSKVNWISISKYKKKLLTCLFRLLGFADCELAHYQPQRLHAFSSSRLIVKLSYYIIM